MSEKKYTAADFAAAEFAKRPNGDMAARLDPEDTLPWRVVKGRELWSWFNDYDMAEEGWVPVPSSPATPTITESELRETIMGGSGFADAIRAGVTASLSRLGIEVVPDPVPSNAELLARDLDELNGDGFLIQNRHKEMIANLLIERGWVKQSVGEAR